MTAFKSEQDADFQSLTKCLENVRRILLSYSWKVCYSLCADPSFLGTISCPLIGVICNIFGTT